MNDLAMFHDRVQSAFVNSVVNGDLYFHSGKLLQAHRLDPEDVRRLRDLYVPHGDTLERAALAARERGLVVLCGDPGSGRFITAVNVAADLGLEARRLVVDDDEPLTPPGGRQRGYVLNLRDSGRDLALVGRELPGFVARLRETGSCLVVLATDHELTRLDLTVPPEVVRVRPSDPRQVFQAYLAQWLSAEETRAWASDSEILGVLTGSSPQVAVRLAGCVWESGHLAPQAGVGEVLAAFRNWRAELTGWFKATEEARDGYRRALLLAVAALEGSPVTDVFAAAELLCATSAIDYLPGKGLIGPGITEHLDGVDASRVDGQVRFRHPGYGTAVFDHVWEERPFFRQRLVDWLTGLRADRPVTVLLDLATRNGQAELVLKAVEKWSQQDQPWAADVLGAAAMSVEIGREVRRRMYDWATSGRADAVLTVVAAVCGGPMADTFDRVAFTRLRHLAGNPSGEVQDAVVRALTDLVRRPRLRLAALQEVVRWTEGSGRGAETGSRAFVDLAALRTPEGRPLLLPAGDAEALTGVLADGWRAALRDPGVVEAAGRVAIGWLDDVAHGRVDEETVHGIFVRACRSSRDTATLMTLFCRWAFGGRGDDAGRERVCVELLRRIGAADTLTPGISPFGVHDGEGTAPWVS
ncbi:hypothetical protein [Microtetraspora malaysiensis]|uniref:AAA+ ATPase domain-containing protein n=1 Tax=Microtetraspora malaysiensis TaxID=161358 RepID=A0ABW6SHX4_9ACTN